MRKGMIRWPVLAVGLSSILLLAAYAHDEAGQPASKATARMSQFSLLIPQTQQDWTTILSNTIKTPNQKDLFIDVSLECGMYTRTLVSSTGGTNDSSMAQALIRVRVLIDNVEAAPTEATFATRVPNFSAALVGMISGALTTNALGNVVVDETLATPEQIQLMLATVEANSFNFVAADLGPGAHTIQVQAKIDVWPGAPDRSAEAFGLVGRGSVTVEQVRLIRNEDISLP